MTGQRGHFVGYTLFEIAIAGQHPDVVIQQGIGVLVKLGLKHFRCDGHAYSIAQPLS